MHCLQGYSNYFSAFGSSIKNAGWKYTTSFEGFKSFVDICHYGQDFQKLNGRVRFVPQAVLFAAAPTRFLLKIHQVPSMIMHIRKSVLLLLVEGANQNRVPIYFEILFNTQGCASNSLSIFRYFFSSHLSFLFFLKQATFFLGIISSVYLILSSLGFQQSISLECDLKSLKTPEHQNLMRFFVVLQHSSRLIVAMVYLFPLSLHVVFTFKMVEMGVSIAIDVLKQDAEFSMLK